MDRYEAARALGVADADVLSVADAEYGTEVEMRTGGRRLIREDGVWALDEHPGSAHLRRWCALPPLPESAYPPDAEPLEDVEASEAAEYRLTPKDGSGVPSGTADDVLAWVGDDSKRAIAALEAEEKRDRPRGTLVAKLEKVVG